MQTLEQKVDTLTTLVGELVERQRRQQDFIEDLVPISQDVLHHASRKLERLEQRGWFDMGREGLDLLDSLAEAYGPDDVRTLADSAVTILDAVRAVTQPEVMTLIAEAGEVLQHGDELSPKSPWEAVTAARDPDVRRGIAVLVEVLKQVGRASKDLHPGGTVSGRARRERLLARRTAPRRIRATPVAATAEAAPQEPLVCPTDQAISVPGWELDSSGFLTDASAWTEAFAHQMAAQVGVPELTEEHWSVIRYARQVWADSGESPNIRRITLGSGVSTKALYALWPCAPGKTTARVAGLPKPVGCL